MKTNYSKNTPKPSRRVEFRGTIVGASSLLVIFAVLCLTVFALLSLSTAVQGRKLSEISRDKTLAYYEAEAEAERIIASVRKGKSDSRVTAEDGGRIRVLTLPCGENTELTVRFTSDETISKTTRSTVAWEPDDMLDLWDGE